MNIELDAFIAALTCSEKGSLWITFINHEKDGFLDASWLDSVPCWMHSKDYKEYIHM